MQWWVWALIAAGALVVGYFKLKVFNALMKKKKAPKFRDED